MGTIYYSETSQQEKAKATVFLVAKYGDVCWYDKMPFHENVPGRKRTIDHLVRSDDDRIQNVVLCCEACQQKKKSNFDMQILAAKQLKANLDAGKNFFRFAGDGDSVGVEIARIRPAADELTDGEINRIINQTCKKYLAEKLPMSQPKQVLMVNETVNSITFLVQEETGGRGSPPAVLRALEVRCSAASEFEIVKEKRPYYIQRRQKK